MKGTNYRSHCPCGTRLSYMAWIVLRSWVRTSLVACLNGCSLCLFVFHCAGSGLVTGRSVVQSVLRSV